MRKFVLNNSKLNSGMMRMLMEISIRDFRRAA